MGWSWEVPAAGSVVVPVSGVGCGAGVGARGHVGGLGCVVGGLPLLTDPVEGVVAQHVAAHPCGCASAAGSHDQHQFAVRHCSQQAFHQGRAQKAGGTRDGDALAGEGFGYHAVMSSA